LFDICEEELQFMTTQIQKLDRNGNWYLFSQMK